MRAVRRLHGALLPALLLLALVAAPGTWAPQLAPVAATGVDLVPTLRVVTPAGSGTLGLSEVTVHNVGGAPSSGEVVVRGVYAPEGGPAPSGTGWTCERAECSTTASAPAGGALPVLRVASGPTPLPNQYYGPTVTVTGGGDEVRTDDTVALYTTADDGAHLSLAVVPSDEPMRVGVPFAVEVLVTNRTPLPWTQPVVVGVGSTFSDDRREGDGWLCSSGSEPCEHAGPLAPGATLPPLVLTMTPRLPLPEERHFSAALVLEPGAGHQHAVDVRWPVAELAGPAALQVQLLGPARVQAGGTSELVAQVINRSAYDVPGSVLDLSSTDVTVVSATGAGVACPSATRCSLPSLAPGGSASVRLLAQVPAGAVGAVRVTAQVQHDDGRAVGSLRMGVLDRGPDLVAVPFTESVTPQGVGTYRVRVANAGTSGHVGRTDVRLTMQTVEAASGSGWRCSLAALTCRAEASVPAGGHLPDLRVVMRWREPGNEGDSYLGLAVIADDDVEPANNDAGLQQAVPTDVRAELAVEVDAVGTAVPGGTADFDAVVHNLGAVAHTGRVGVWFQYAAGTWSGDGWTCVQDAGTYCTTAAEVPAGGTLPPVRLSQAVGELPGGYLFPVRVIVDGDGDRWYANNRADDVHLVRAPASSVHAVVHPGRPVAGGDRSRFELEVVNLTADASAPLTAQVYAYDSTAGTAAVSANGWTCETALRCTHPPLAPGAEALPLLVDLTARNGAALMSLGGDVSGGTGSNTATTGGGGAGADVTVSYAASGPLVVGRAVATTVHVGNTGYAPATGTLIVRLDTRVPAAVSGDGWSCTGGGSTATCSRSDGIPARGLLPPITAWITADGSPGFLQPNVLVALLGRDLQPLNDSGWLTLPVVSPAFAATAAAAFPGSVAPVPAPAPVTPVVTGGALRYAPIGSATTLSGTARPGATAQVWGQRRGEAGFSLRKRVLADSTGHWQTSYTAGDYRFYVVADGRVSNVVARQASPVVTSPVRNVVVLRGTAVTVSGRGVPGTTTVMRLRRATDPPGTYPLSKTIRVPAGATWSVRFVVDQTYALYVSRGGQDPLRSTPRLITSRS